MSRELDFIDFINEQAEKEGHSEPSKPLTNRELLLNALESINEYPSEKDILIKYQDTLLQLNQKEEELHEYHELLSNIHAGDDKNYLADTKKGLQKSASNIASQRDALERQLIDLQQNSILQKIIEQERWKDLRQKASQSMKELRAKYEEHKKREQMEQEEEYQEMLSRISKKREEAKAQPDSKTIPKLHKEEPKVEALKENNLMNLIASKRIAAIISIILCVVLYLSFLSAFTTKRDTYICYTTKTGECFHSATCDYISKSAYETTVYEASRKYRPCNYCNPCVKSYETTITERNYVAPLLISVPISAAVFLLLTYRKKN